MTDSPSSGSTSGPEPPRRRAIYPRKGHTKSRRGCYSCKKRKIKCQETLPECANCIRSGLRCQYPDRPVITALQHNPQPIVTLNSTANNFSLTDMRLFHHYLSTAYPHFPLASESTWLNYITPIGHQCEYLMHALLALSASHLEKLAPSSLVSISRSHAQSAMAGLNKVLSNPITDAEAGDAAIATCYALLMQSWYMDDGLSSFLVLSRSCQAVSERVRGEGVNAVFAKETRREMVTKFRERIEGAPKFDPIFLEQARKSLESVRKLCGEPFEIELTRKLELCFENLCSSPYQAYLHHVSIDEMVVDLTSEQLNCLLDPSNQVCRLLLAHMIAMYLIMRPVSCRERRQYTATMYGIRMQSWVDTIEKSLDDMYKPYCVWPSMVSELNQKQILELYTLDEVGARQWSQRFAAGSTNSLSSQSLSAIRLKTSKDAMMVSSPYLLGVPTPESC